MKKIKVIIVITLITVITAISGKKINAQSAIPLTVSPARQQITINPGESAVITVKFYNNADIPISGIVQVADFIVQAKDGSPRIIDDATLALPRFSAASWMDLPVDRIAIPTGDKTIVQATINVPTDARPGGRYVSLYFEPSTAVPQAIGNETAGQGVASRIASLIYIRVAGPITENAIISNLFAKSFYEYGPIDITSEILNRGDYHIRPRGILSLSDTLGGLVEQSSLEEQNIFPDAAREYHNTLGTKWMFGRYTINLTASYGEGGRALERAIHIWVFPWKIAVIVLLALVIFFLALRNVYGKIARKEIDLEKEIAAEREEIEKLRQELKKRKE